MGGLGGSLGGGECVCVCECLWCGAMYLSMDVLLPGQSNSAGSSGATVAERVCGRERGWETLPACLPFFIFYFLKFLLFLCCLFFLFLFNGGRALEPRAKDNAGRFSTRAHSRSLVLPHLCRTLWPFLVPDWLNWLTSWPCFLSFLLLLCLESSSSTDPSCANSTVPSWPRLDQPTLTPTPPTVSSSHLRNRTLDALNPFDIYIYIYIVSFFVKKLLVF